MNDGQVPVLGRGRDRRPAGVQRGAALHGESGEPAAASSVPVVGERNLPYLAQDPACTAVSL